MLLKRSKSVRGSLEKNFSPTRDIVDFVKKWMLANIYFVFLGTEQKAHLSGWVFDLMRS